MKLTPFSATWRDDVAKSFNNLVASGNVEQLANLVLAANKVFVTNNAGAMDLIALGTLGRALLALASGTTDQYIDGTGALQPKLGLPISTATQTALNAKLTTTSLLTEMGVRVQVAGVGSVGTYAFCQNNTGLTLTPGQGTAGTGISYASQAGSPGIVPPGNWICMGHVSNTDRTLFFRFS